jgi:hypothetical protein
MKKLLLLLMFGMFFISLTSANDIQTTTLCGGDQQTSIQCFGDNQLSGVGQTEEKVGVNKVTTLGTPSFRYLLYGSAGFILLTVFIVLVAYDVYKKRQKRKR